MAGFCHILDLIHKPKLESELLVIELGLEIKTLLVPKLDSI